MRPWQKLLTRADQLLPLLLAHQTPAAQLPGPNLTTPEPNKSQVQNMQTWNGLYTN